MPAVLFDYLYVYASACLPVCLLSLPTFLSVCLPIYLPAYLLTFLSTHLPTNQLTCPSDCPFTCTSVCSLFRTRRISSRIRRYARGKSSRSISRYKIRSSVDIVVSRASSISVGDRKRVANAFYKVVGANRCEWKLNANAKQDIT